MTAKINFGGDWEDERMEIHNQKQDHIDELMEPDEGWWAAVLADEPLLDDEEDLIEPYNGYQSGGDALANQHKNTDVNWEKIESIFRKDEIVALNVVGLNRGGVLVAGEDIHGFVPASHLVDLPADCLESDREIYLSDYLDRKIDLKVIECEPEKERIVFSERAALAKEGQRKHLLSSLKEGDIICGVVTNVTSFGVFVDLGGLEGLIHISELSWGRVKHPSEILKVDDKIKTMVLQVSEDEGRIALSLKRLFQNPWKVLAAKLSPDDIVEATITCIVNYGAFAEIEGGVEGLIHVSSMTFPEGCSQIDDFLYEGQRVMVRVLSIDALKRRLGLQIESYLPDHEEQ
jgi:small subunit ribosomal protein S1